MRITIDGKEQAYEKVNGKVKFLPPDEMIIDG